MINPCCYGNAICGGQKLIEVVGIVVVVVLVMFKLLHLAEICTPKSAFWLKMFLSSLRFLQCTLYKVDGTHILKIRKNILHAILHMTSFLFNE